MSTPDDPVKKIVSKGKYAQVQGLRAGTFLWGIGLIVAGIVCAVIALCLCVTLIVAFPDGSHMSGLTVVAVAVCAALCAAGTYRLGKMGVTKIEQAERMNNVVPLTRITAPYLSAPESLVRASGEPIQEQQTVLLRAATQTQERHEEQLLRYGRRGGVRRKALLCTLF